MKTPRRPASTVVETKGFVPTPATLDAEVEGEIVKTDGTPVASVASSESKPKVCTLMRQAVQSDTLYRCVQQTTIADSP